MKELHYQIRPVTGIPSFFISSNNLFQLDPSAALRNKCGLFMNLFFTLPFLQFLFQTHISEVHIVQQNIGQNYVHKHFPILEPVVVLCEVINVHW